MKWLTNGWLENKDADIEKYKFGDPSRKIVVGEPKASDELSVEEMKELDIIGLYEVA
ncbi:hypothetical protein M0R72_19690 [Candidatus Pacearchaeota archaeon]|jgi:hypothetical protein|nr:hypothetical protein [Candidatus Pacearchaeota archaeon]